MSHVGKPADPAAVAAPIPNYVKHTEFRQVLAVGVDSVDRT